MKRIAALVIALASFTTPARAADALRSDKHLLKIDVQSLSGISRQYHVQVFDAESRKHVAHLKAVTKNDQPEESETTANGTRYQVRIEPHGAAYLITFSAENGTERIDTMRGGFTQAVAADHERPQPSRAGHDIDLPAVLRRIEPVYTAEAKAAGAAGTVVMEVLIDRSGFVRDATVIKTMGYGLDDSAIDAVRQWRFAPSMRQHVPVEVMQEVTIEFKP